MFQIHVQHPLDDDWEARDVQLRNIAGRKWDHSWADRTTRYLSWTVATFAEAKLWQRTLAGVIRTTVTVREQ